MKRLQIIPALVAVACLAMAGCATQNIVAGSSNTWGVGAEDKPDGTVAAAIGATTSDFVTVPLLPKTGAPVTVPTMCGGQDAVSTLGTITGSAAAGVQTAKAPAVSLTMGRGLATGEPARLLALADLQAAAPNVDVMQQYHNCQLVTPPAAAAAAPAQSPSTATAAPAG